MFHEIPEAVAQRMRELEEQDRRDRNEGNPGQIPLWQVPPETGRFLAIQAAGAPDGKWVEIGTSAGYSALWLSLACRARGRALTTFEIEPQKVRVAAETFRQAGVRDLVTLVEGDIRDHLVSLPDVGFCFLDAAKELYTDFYEVVVPRLVRGGLLLADNVVSHPELRAFVERATSDPRVDAVVVPIGQGVLLCRRC